MDQRTILLLTDFFPEEDVQWLPGAVSGDKSKALAMPYIDARAVMDRLDEAVGPGGWQDDYTILEGGSIECRLALAVGPDGRWISKCDVAAPAGSDPADRIKGGYSGALKRAAVKWGIGRYLYDVPTQWLPFDGRKFVQAPHLPKEFLPKGIGLIRAAELERLVKAAEVNPEEVLKFFEAKTWADIPYAKYAPLRRRFLEKIASK